ncbi:LysR substrate-binding domain-containing protein [Bradyrhizobium sp. LHD-71]|uniref:LysR family transcriptional regulator n=1 Tax=Bradyrhizobium sp. LHD-71 TaxID=3072141 RepID=UPI00280EDF28|nr:LysR substrate-binding domain-containing protein [Bradyrhizobium sp. LHD-71]MDQ8728029.1 LysR substrate-binding domain-containing protein [Bradyrhizobium sp. LHD-71]
MPQVNFKLLHMFIAVAENRSFRLASEHLNRSQSAVSMQIKLLEEQVGVALFHRTTRRVELTAEGQQLLAHARRALSEWDNGLREIRGIVDMQRGTLSFACVPTIAATILPQALRVFQASYPGISVNLRELAAEDLLDCIRRRDADFGIGPGMERLTEFQFTPLFNDPIYALATRAFPFRKRASIDLAELCNFPILLNSKSAALRAMLERALAVRDLQMKIAFEVVHTHTLIALAAAGLGVGILPKVALPLPLRKNMQAAPIGIPPLVRSVGILTLKGQTFSPAAAALTAAVQKFIRPRG